jgi:hypothetical protein
MLLQPCFISIVGVIKVPSTYMAMAAGFSDRTTKVFHKFFALVGWAQKTNEGELKLGSPSLVLPRTIPAQDLAVAL